MLTDPAPGAIGVARAAPAAARPPAPAPAPAPAQPARTGTAAGTGTGTDRPHGRRPPAKAPATAGLPRWLEIVLLAAWPADRDRLPDRAGPGDRPPTPPGRPPAPGPPDAGPAACPPAQDPRILLADYDRLVVTSSGPDGTVCVLRPPGADPEAILLAARLVLAQDRYEQLAGHLGVRRPPAAGVTGRAAPTGAQIVDRKMRAGHTWS